MSAMTRAKLGCRIFSVHLPPNLGGYNIKIRDSCLLSVHCSRGFKGVHTSVKSITCLIPSQSTAKNWKENSAVATDDRVVMDIVQDLPCFTIDQSSLMHIVEMRSLDQLHKFGGVHGIANSLNSDVHRGIDSDDNAGISRRHEAFGTNTYSKAAGKNLFHLVWEAFDDSKLNIFLAFAMMALGFDIKSNGLMEGLYDGGSIFSAVLVVLSIVASTDFRKNRNFSENFMVSDSSPVEVMRNGKPKHISTSEVAVGDVICLKIGDQVPADGLLIEGQALRVDESSMTTTGSFHDHEIQHHDQNPFLFSGTKVTVGCARMLVTSVGMNTTRGKMLSSMSSESIEHTPLKARISRLISSIGEVGSGAAVVAFVLNLIQTKRNYNLERRKKKLKELAMVFTASSSVVSSISRNVFGVGKYISKLLKVEQQTSIGNALLGFARPPKPLLIGIPSEAGVFPVLLFIHGYLLYNSFYSQLVQHIASHGFIVIAPQLYSMAGPDTTEEINATAEIANWLSEGLQNLLPPKVQANLSKLALAGHSRGGKVAFGVALGKAVTSLKFSALIGIDPVDGVEKGKQMPPILTYNPHSFNLDMAVSIIGSGLGELRSNFLFPPSAPKGVNHKDFYNECQKPACYFVARDYGHLDMLDDDTSGLRGKATYCLCKNGESRDPMRRFVGGIMVAFMRNYLEGNSRDLQAIRDGHLTAPVELQNVDFLV
ncbi:uncharacterized protein [Coffea arabica]|uniref:chlorophyllase n=1 Tax=Coffea arabica TaxID=13443 RepID=A0A6P6WV30_COFAR|nr:uncharacterized protein LOC113734829 isoform X1 [Coffea arabica]